MKSLAIVFLCVAYTHAAFVCPEGKRGYLRDAQQCDKFYDCHRGNGEAYLCPDGLAFDDVQQKCDYEFNAFCLENTYFQAPRNRSVACPRDNGFFEHEDPTKCSKYYWCVNGEAHVGTCENDNHFDEVTGVCVWPHKSHRKNCVKEKVVHPSGYECDPTVPQFQNGNKLVHTLHPDPYDCSSFYTCFNGRVPQKATCPGGKIFNDITLVCDDPANIVDLEIQCPEYVGVVKSSKI